MDRTLILVKPDAFARNLTGEIIARFERKGLRIAALRHMTLDRPTGRAALRRARGQAVLRGARVVHHAPGRWSRWSSRAQEAVIAARQVIGATNPLEAVAGLDPRRLRDRGRPEHGPRVRLAGVGRARGEPVLPPELILASASPQRRAILAQVRPAVHGRARRRGGAGRRRAAGGGGRERAPQGARGRPRRARARRRHARGGRRRDPRQAARRRAGGRVRRPPGRPRARGRGRDRARPRRRGDRPRRSRSPRWSSAR